MTPFTVADLFAPLTTDQFLDRYYQKDFLHLPGTPDKFSQLFSWDVLNRLLEEHRWDGDHIKLRKEEKAIPADEYLETLRTDWGDPIQRIQPGKFTKLLRDGATMSMYELHSIHRPLTLFLGQLSRLLKGHCDVILFASFGSTRAISKHEDGDDNLVLQIAGRKHWKLFGESEKYPLRKPIWHEAQVAPTEVVWERTLEAGDILYLPRGWWHEVQSVDEPSLHLTVGLPLHSGLDLLKWAFPLLARHEIVRQSLPVFTDDSARRQHRTEFLEAIAATLHPDIIADYYRDVDSARNLNGTNPGLPFSVLKEDGVLPEAAKAIRYAGVSWVADPGATESKSFTFRAMGRSWKVPTGARCWLQPLLDGEDLSFRQIRDLANQSGMSSDEVSMLFAHLVREELLLAE